MAEAGVLRKLEKEWLRNSVRCSQGTVAVADLQDVLGAVAVLGAGVLGAVLLCCVENFVQTDVFHGLSSAIDSFTKRRFRLSSCL